MPHANTARQLLVLDPRVADWRVLAAHARPGVAVLRLDPRACGVAQIAAALAEIGPVEALHLVDHASPGWLRVGSTVLTAETLDAAAPCLGQLGSALEAGARVVIWGCDLAATPAGEAFVLRLARALGREVAAATGPVGEAALGGTWTLGFGSGSPAGHPAEAVAPLGLASFRGTLSAPVLTFVPPANGSYGTGRVLTFTLNASSPISIEPGPFAVSLGLVIGATARSAALDVAASTATSLVFRYTVQAGESDADGITVGALSDPGGRLSAMDGDPIVFVAGAAGQLAQVLVDTTPPTAALTPPANAIYGLGSVLTFTLTTNEPVTVAAGADPVTLGLIVGSTQRQAVLDAAASTGTSLVFRYTVAAGDNDADGIEVTTLSDPGGRVKDVAGNNLSFASNSVLAQVKADAVRPVATLDPPADGAYRAGDTLTFALELNEDVAIAAGSHPISLGLTIGGQARSAALDAGASTATRLVFTYTVQAGENSAGIVVRSLSDPGARVADLAGNPLFFNARQAGQLANVVVDTTAPSASLEGPSAGRYKEGDVLSFTLVANEALSVAAGMDPVELAVTVGSQGRVATYDAGASTATRLVFTYTVQAGETDADGVAVGALSDAGGRVRDLAGNPLSFAGGGTLSTVLVDTTAPSATLSGPSNGLFAAGQVLTFTLATDEPVAIAAGAQPVTLGLVIGGVAREAVLDAAASNSTQLVFRYLIQPGEEDADGIEVGALGDPGGRVTDIAGNALAFDAGGQLFAGVLVDGIAPQFTSLQLPPDGVRKIGDVIFIGLNSSEALSVAAGADPVTLAVSVGGQQRAAQYVQLDNADTRLIFRLEVQEGDLDADGIEIGAMSDPGGRVRDLAGNLFTYAGGQAVPDITVDAVRPAALLVPPPDGAYGPGSTLTFRLDLDEAVTVAMAGQPVTLDLTLGGAARSAALDIGASTATQLVFTYTVQAGDVAANGIVVGALSDPDGRVQDAAGNTLLFAGGTALAGVIADGVPPTATLVAPASGAYKAGAELSFVLLLSEAVTLDPAGAPITLGLDIGGQARTAEYDAAASTATSLAFRYIIQAGDNDADGIEVTGLGDPDGRLADAAGNLLVYNTGTALPGVILDTVAPAASLVAPALSLLRIGQTLAISLDVSEAVVLAAGAQPVTLAITIGTETRQVPLDEILGGTRLVFRTQVAPGDLDADGVALGALTNPGGRLQDAAGNALAFDGLGTVLADVMVDGVAPTATVSSPSAGLLGIGGHLVFELATSEAVGVAFGADPVFLGITVGGAVRQAALDIGASTATNLVFRYTVQAGDFAMDGITIGALGDVAGRVTDLAGNPLVFAGGIARPDILVDGIAPGATLSGPAGVHPAGTVLSFRLDTTEAITVRAGGQPITLGLTVGAEARTASFDAAASTANSLVFRYTVLPGDLDTDGIAVGALNDPGTRLVDAAGNALVFAGAHLPAVRADAVPPSATFAGPAVGAYPIGSTLTFTLSVNEPVTVEAGVHPVQLGLTIGSAARYATLDAGASTATSLVFRYTVQAGDMAAGGVRLGALSDPGGRVVDAGGNPLAFNAREAGFLPTVTVDGVAPVGTLLPPANGTRVAGEVLDFAIILSEPVAIAAGGQPVALGLQVGSASRLAEFQALSGDGLVMWFRTTILPGDLDADGIEVGSLVDPAARVTDAAGNPVVFTGNQLLAGLRVDAVPPTASLAPVAPGSFATGEALSFSLVTSEPVVVAPPGAPVTLELQIAGQTRLATLDAGASTATNLVFRYTLTSADRDTNGITVGALSDPSGRVTDAAGNLLVFAGGDAVAGLLLNRPAAPVITGFTPDTGVPGDGLTNATSVTISGTASPGALVELQVGGGAIGAPVAADAVTGSWSVVLPAGSLPIEATYVIRAREVGAEFEGAFTPPFLIAVDRTAPGTPTLVSAGGDTTAPYATEDRQPILTGGFDIGDTATLTATLNGEPIAVERIANTWRVAVDTPLPLGPHSLVLTATDMAGNVTTASYAFSVVDVTPPAITGIAASAAPVSKAGDVLTFTAMLSEPVFILADIDPIGLTLAMGAEMRFAELDAAASTATSLVFRYTVQAGDLDADGVTVTGFADPGGQVRDVAGNLLGWTGPLALPAVAVDAVPPTATLFPPVGTTYGLGQQLAFMLSVSEAVTVAPGAAPLALLIEVGGQPRTAILDAAASTSQALVFRYDVQPGDLEAEGIFVLGLSEPARVQDAAGNALSFAGSVALPTVTVDGVPPSASLVPPAAGLRGAGAELSFTLETSEAVSIAPGATPILLGLQVGALATHAALDAAASTATSLVFRYTIGAGQLDADGITVGALSDPGGRLRDAAGNLLSFAGGQALAGVTVDAVAPQASFSGPVAGLRRLGDELVFTLTADEAVLVAPGEQPVQLGLVVGATARQATLDAASSTPTSLVFRYTVQPGDLDTDGIAVTGLTDPGGRLRDLAGNALVWNGPVALPAVLVDGVPPPPPVVARLEAGETGFTLSGTAEPGSTIELWSGEILVTTAPVSGTGAWSVEFSYGAVTDPAFAVSAKARDVAGNLGGGAAPVVLGRPVSDGLMPRPFFGLPGMLPDEIGLRLANPAAGEAATVALGASTVTLPPGAILTTVSRAHGSDGNGLSGPAARIASVLGGIELPSADEGAFLNALAGGVASTLPVDTGVTLLRVSGPASAGFAFTNTADALVLDFRDVPGAQAALNGVGFAIVIGAVTLTGGAGNNIVLGDGSAQVMRLGPGDDWLFGGGGNDILVSDGGSDIIDGGDGDDIIFGGAGEDLLRGGAGDDVLSGAALDRGEWSIRLAGDGRIFAVFTPMAGLGPSVEYDFDQLVEDVPWAGLRGIAAGRLQAITALYDAMGRVPDLDGLIAWGSSGLSLAAIADAFLASAEGQAVFGGLGNAAFVSRLYERILDRAPDQGGLEAWTSVLASGAMTRAQALLGFTLSAERDTIEEGGIELAFLESEGMGWIAGSGDDRLEGGAGNDRLIGGDGIDTAVFSGLRSGYSVRREGKEWIVEDLVAARDGTDRLIGIERVEFADQLLHIELASDAAFQVAGLYEALFDRAPDLEGLRWWMDAMGKGATLKDLAGAFLLSAEAAPLRAMGNAAFVGHLYDTLFEREADADGFAFWTGALNAGFSRAEMTALFLESEEFLRSERDELTASLASFTAVW